MAIATVPLHLARYLLHHFGRFQSTRNGEQAGTMSVFRYSPELSMFVVLLVVRGEVVFTLFNLSSWKLGMSGHTRWKASGVGPCLSSGSLLNRVFVHT